MNDIELFEQARNRVQRKIKGRCVTNKDVIIDQEKEIEYYRNKIKQIIDIQEIKQELDKQFEITIKDEEYLIKYNEDADIVMINAYIVKLICEPEVYKISKDNKFKIINKTRMGKLHEFEW